MVFKGKAQNPDTANLLNIFTVHEKIANSYLWTENILSYFLHKYWTYNHVPSYIPLTPHDTSAWKESIIFTSAASGHLEVKKGSLTPCCKNLACYDIYCNALDLGRFFGIIYIYKCYNNYKMMPVFLDVALCSTEDTDECLRGAYCLLHCPDNGGSKNSEKLVYIYHTT